MLKIIKNLFRKKKYVYLVFYGTTFWKNRSEFVLDKKITSILDIMCIEGVIRDEQKGDDKIKVDHYIFLRRK